MLLLFIWTHLQEIGSRGTQALHAAALVRCMAVVIIVISGGNRSSCHRAPGGNIRRQ